MKWIKYIAILSFLAHQVFAQNEQIIQEPTERLNYRRVDIKLDKAEDFGIYDINANGQIVAAPGSYSDKPACFSIFGFDNIRQSKVCLPLNSPKASFQNILINDSGDVAGTVVQISQDGTEIYKIFRLIKGGTFEIYSSPNTEDLKQIEAVSLNNDGSIIGSIFDSGWPVHQEASTNNRTITYKLAINGNFTFVNDSSSLSNIPFGYSNGKIFGHTLQIRNNGIGVETFPWIFDLGLNKKVTPTELEKINPFDPNQLKSISSEGEYHVGYQLYDKNFKKIYIRTKRLDGPSRKFLKKVTSELYSLTEDGYKVWSGTQSYFANGNDIFIQKGNAVSKSLICGLPSILSNNLRFDKIVKNGMVLFKDDSGSNISIFIPSEVDMLPNSCLYSKIKLDGITAKHFKQSYQCETSIKRRNSGKNLSGRLMTATITIKDSTGKAIKGAKISYDEDGDGKSFVKTYLTNKKGEAKVEFKINPKSDSCNKGYFSVSKYGYSKELISILDANCSSCSDV